MELLTEEIHCPNAILEIETKQIFLFPLFHPDFCRFYHFVNWLSAEIKSFVNDNEINKH